MSKLTLTLRRGNDVAGFELDETLADMLFHDQTATAIRALFVQHIVRSYLQNLQSQAEQFVQDHMTEIE